MNYDSSGPCGLASFTSDNSYSASYAGRFAKYSPSSSSRTAHTAVGGGTLKRSWFGQMVESGDKASWTKLSGISSSPTTAVLSCPHSEDMP